MNDMNPLEKQLASWTPRPPSPRVRQRLFPATDYRPPVQIPAWLRPAAASTIVFVAFLYGMVESGTGQEPVGGTGSNMLASLPSPYVLTDKHTPQWNVWSVVTFEWTKATSSMTTTGSFLMPKTNLLKL